MKVQKNSIFIRNKSCITLEMSLLAYWIKVLISLKNNNKKTTTELQFPYINLHCIHKPLMLTQTGISGITKQ